MAIDDPLQRRWRLGVMVAAVAMGVGLASWSCDRKDPSGPPPDTNGSTSIPGPGEPTPERDAGSVPIGETPSLETGAAPLERVMALADPSRDERWETEAFSEEASAVLKKLLAWMEAPDEAAPPLETFVDGAAFRTTVLRPGLESVSRRPPFEVFRPASVPTEAEAVFTGIDGLREALTALAAPLFEEPEGEFHGKFKVVGVEPMEEAGEYATPVYYEGHRGRVQQTAEWRCRWTAAGKGGDADDAHPLLSGIELVRFEEIHVTQAGPVFVDCTEAVLGGNESYRTQLAYPASHWHGNLDVAFGIHQGNQGLALGDVNGDGLDDLFLAQPAGLPNRLFLQQPDGTLADHTSESGLDHLDVTRSALIIDLDNDGDQDFVLGHGPSLTLFENDGRGVFAPRTTLHTESGLRGIAAADFDNDGRIDLYACGYAPTGQTSPEDIFANPVPYEDAENGAFNHLFRNEGGFAFSDVTAESGLDANNTRFSFAAAWEDFDLDGDQDLYVANDFGRNNLYRNDLVPGGRPVFTDVAANLGVEDIGAGMAVDWGDPDNDGDPDLHVANMWSSAGHRITFQRQFKKGADDETVRMLQRHARGNSLFLNHGADGFEDASLAAGVNMGRWAWGSLFFDIDDDGWEDIYVANGFMTAPDTGDL